MGKNIIANKKIAIIGGGPVGLTTALLLQGKGAQIKLYERDVSSDARISGGSLDLHFYTGQLAMKEAGILEEFYQLSYPPAEKSTTMSGEVYAEDIPTEQSKYLKPEIDRNDLRTLLCKHINDDVIVWDKKFKSLEKQEYCYVLHFEDGLSETADIVIGANGGRSNLRNFLSDAGLQYTGTYLLQGTIEYLKEKCPSFYKLCGDSNIMVVAENHALATHYIANGSMVFDISFRQPENWFAENKIDLNDNIKVVNFLNDALKNWNPKYKELFTASRDFKGYPMRYIPLDKWKKHQGITLIGDAAHLMPPFAGVGVNIGLMDALNLTKNLTEGRFNSIDEAIADYEKKMFDYAKDALEASLQAEINIHSNKDADELLRGRNEWNEQLANPEQKSFSEMDVYSDFKAKVLSSKPFRSTVKFIVGDRKIFIDGRSEKNIITDLDSSAACTITISFPDFQKLVSGRVSTTVAFMSGKLTVSGDMSIAFKIRTLF